MRAIQFVAVSWIKWFVAGVIVSIIAWLLLVKWNMAGFDEGNMWPDPFEQRVFPIFPLNPDAL